MTKTPTPASHAVNTAPISADLRWIEQDARELPEPSPTADMSLGQRIMHVGGRENAAGYIEFGSVAAVRALVAQVLRDLPARTTPAQCLHQIAEPAQARPGLDELQKRIAFDAIRGAYDLGYNDARNARNARAVPGDSAPGYKDRNVEADHGGALVARIDQLAAPASPAQQDAPAAQPSRESLQQSADVATYPLLPEPVADWVTRGSVSVGGGRYGHEIAREGLFTAEQMLAYADAARAAQGGAA